MQRHRSMLGFVRGSSTALAILCAEIAGCSGDQAPQTLSPQASSTPNATPAPAAMMNTAGAAPVVAGNPGARSAAASGVGAVMPAQAGAGAGVLSQAGSSATTAAAGSGAGGVGGMPGAGRGPAGAGGASGSNQAPAGGAGAAGGATATAGATGSAGCMKGMVKAGEVAFIGDSFIALSGAIPRDVTQLARQAGTIGMMDSYRSYAVSGTQLTTGAIPMQFMSAVRAGAVKVVLMNGAGNDLLIGSRCQSGFDDGCKQITSTVGMLFDQMKMNGVKDVVYFFYPDPMGVGAGIKNAMDTLRPEMKKVCDGAMSVRCIWVDQRESWNGKYATFTSDGIHPTDAGATASAKQIWDAMVANCVAQ